MPMETRGQGNRGVGETGGQRRLGRHGNRGFRGGQGGFKIFLNLRVVLEEAAATKANNTRASAFISHFAVL